MFSPLTVVSLMVFVSLGFSPVQAAPIETNAAFFSEAPSWLDARRVNRVVDQIQRVLEWDIRKVKVQWYLDAKTFQKFHGYDSSVLAVTRRQDNSIHLGPSVSSENFDSVFGHELVHVILYQKYKDSIPKWLEEGLCNFVAKRGPVDYPWLASQPKRNVRTLVHPFQDAPLSYGQSNARYHYQASTALVEMIASKCSLKDILQLSVGKKLENYLGTFCGLSDIDDEFNQWVRRKSKDERAASHPPS